MNTPPPFSSRNGLRNVIVVGLLLGVVAFLLRDYQGFPFRLFGSLVWIFFFSAIFVAGGAYFALFLMPSSIENPYLEAIQQLQDYLSRGAGKPPVIEYDGVPPSIERLGIGVVDSHIVLALERNRGFSRAVGPGFVKLEPKETIKQVIDLRPHRRRWPMRGMTRDGIPLEGRLVIDFRVRRPAEGGAADNVPFPYDPQAIFEVCYFNSIGESGNEISWIDRVGPLAAGEWVNELANHGLDDLYPVDAAENSTSTNHATLLERANLEVHKRVQKRLHSNGVELLSLRIEEIALPLDVIHQRVDHLHQKWQRQIQKEQTVGDIALVQQVEATRAAAEVALIGQIVDTIEQMKVKNRQELSDVIAMVTIEQLERATLDDQLEIQPQLLQTLSQIQSLFGQSNRLPPPRRTISDRPDDTEVTPYGRQ